MRLILVATLALAACKDNKKKPAQETAEQVEKPAPKPKPIAAERARQLLTAWLAAQNDGKFDAYQVLYATKLVGVKRSGKRVSRFDRTGWLTDRERMFRKNMVVEAGETKIATTANTATISFRQRWASGSYEDVGPKRLLAVLEGGELKIAREEMLESTVVDAVDGVEGVMLVWEIDGVAHLIVEDGAPGITGKTEAGGGKDDVIGTVASVADGDLRPETVALRGKRFRVGSCEAAVTGFVVHSRVVPHFGVTQTWNEDKTSEADKLDEAFASGTQTIAARLDGCAGKGRYATPAAAKPPVRGGLIKAADLRKRAMTAIAGLDEVAKLQNEWIAEGNKGSWLDNSQGAVEVFKHPESGRTIVSVIATEGEGCGDGFYARVWIVFEVKGDELEVVHDGEPPGKVLEAVDIDRDGALELVVEGEYGSGVDLRLLELGGGSIELTHSFDDTTC